VVLDGIPTPHPLCHRKGGCGRVGSYPHPRVVSGGTVDTCATCSAIAGGVIGIFLGLRSRCKIALYCGRTCQTAHWKAGHREVCKAPAGQALEATPAIPEDSPATSQAPSLPPPLGAPPNPPKSQPATTTTAVPSLANLPPRQRPTRKRPPQWVQKSAPTA